jgi:hypothetical protein
MSPIRARGPIRARRGFTLLLVVSAIGALMAFWGVAHRMTASLIRVESSRLRHSTRSAKAVHAMTVLDRALTLLEVGKPTARQKYVYSADLVLPDGTHKLFTVQFTPNDGLPGANNGWTVQVTPGVSGVHLALPNPGDNPPWPPSP